MTFDAIVGLILRYARLVLSVVLMLVIGTALLRLIGTQIPMLRLTEANLQSLGIFIAGAAYGLNALK